MPVSDYFLPTIEISATLAQFRERFCVYQITPFGETTPIYYGVTKFRDVLYHRDAYTNAWFSHNVTEDIELKIRILMSTDTEAEAFNELRKLFSKYRPVANQYGQRSTGKALVTCIEGPNAGRIYKTLSEAAALNGISQGAMSNHINGRPGYDTVHGMKFKRGI